MKKRYSKILVKNMIFLCINIIILLILAIYSFNYRSSLAVSITNIIYIFAINIFYIIRSKKKSSIIQPILIIDVFTIIMFCVRPLFLMFSNFLYIKSLSSAFRIYSYLNNITSLNVLQNAYALYIIAAASFTFNYSYFFNAKDNNMDTKIIIKSEDTKKYGLFVYIILLLASIVFFLFKYNFSYLRQFAGRFQEIGISFSFYEILWLYAFPFAIGYSYYISRKNRQTPFLAIILLILEIVLLTVLTRRSYIVNVFIVLILISRYFKPKKSSNSENKFSKVKSFIYIGLVLLLVIGFSDIRNQGKKYSENESGVVKVLNEFDMYDMFVCSVDYYSTHENNYNGINYLSFPFIPKIVWNNKPDYFDFYNSQIVLKGYFKAGIPTSLFGSLYLNFGLFGMILCCFIIGMLFNKIFRKYSMFNDIHGLMKYSIFLIFTYDFFRVGNLSRELWSIMLYSFCFIICKKLLFLKEREL